MSGFKKLVAENFLKPYEIPQCVFKWDGIPEPPTFFSLVIFCLPTNKGTFLGTPETTLLAMRSTFSFKTFSISSVPKCFPVFLPMKIPFPVYAAVRSMANVWYTLWKRFLKKLEGDWGSWWMSLVKYPQWGDQKVPLDLQREAIFSSEPVSDTKS